MTTYSFPKRERLLKRREFQQVFKNGKRYYSKNFIIIVRSIQEETRKIGIIAGKRAGKAVKRSRFKRLLREFYRLNKGLFPPSSEIVVIVRPFTPILSFADIEDELKRLLSNKFHRAFEIK